MILLKFGFGELWWLDVFKSRLIRRLHDIEDVLLFFSDLRASSAGMLMMIRDDVDWMEEEVIRFLDDQGLRPEDVLRVCLALANHDQHKLLKLNHNKRNLLVFMS